MRQHRLKFQTKEGGSNLRQEFSLFPCQPAQQGAPISAAVHYVLTAVECFPPCTHIRTELQPLHVIFRQVA